jgi:dihydropteroate synthase
MTKIVGILNITPDSFFDGGKYNEQENSLRQLEILLKEGTDVIDVGAESTRPGALPIDDVKEWARLEDILRAIISYVKNYNQKHNKKVEVSLDSRHWKNIRKALALGIDVINDVSGFKSKEMINLAVKSGKKIVVMHNLGIPSDRNKIIDEGLDVVRVLILWMEDKLKNLLKAGVKKKQIIFDIGIGFGKNAAQSIKLLQEIDRFRVLNLPLYVGHSNKGFLDSLVGDDLIEPGLKTREEKTYAISAYLASKNVEYLRVHNVGDNRRWKIYNSIG